MPVAKSTRKSRAAASGDASFTPEQRNHMIAEAAYYYAEKRGFSGGDPVNDWLAAEAEIDCMIQKPTEH